MNLKKNTELVFQQIADASQEANRALDAVSVIAVTKYVDVQTAEALLPLGVRHIGENRVDKFLENLEKRGRDFEQIDENTEKGQKDLAYFKLLHSEYQKWYEDYNYSPKIAIDMNKYDVNNPDDWDEVYKMIKDAFDESVKEQKLNN